MADYKEILDKANSNSNNAFYEETNFKNTHIPLNKLWTDAEYIPEDVSSVTLTNNVYYVEINSIKRSIIEYVSNAELIKIDGTRASFIAENDSLKNSIPFDYGKNYKVTLKDSSGNQIPFGLNSWFIDTENGVLSFDKGVPIGYSQPYTVSFYRYVGRFGNENLLLSDGSILLDDTYRPTVDNSIATKKYVDESQEIVSTLVANAKPQKPSTFENTDLIVTSNRMFEGHFLLSRDLHKVAIEGDDITIETDYFYNEEIGQLDVYIGDYNLTKGRSLYLSKSLKSGFASDYWTVVDNKDCYTGIYANYYNVMKIKCVFPSSLLASHYGANLPFLSFRLVYTGKVSYSSNAFTLGFEAENPRSTISDVDLNVDNVYTKISGVPTLTENTTVKLSAKIFNLNRFYIDKFVKVEVPALNYERDLLPINGAWEGAALYKNVNEPYSLGVILPINENIYTESLIINIYTYDVLGNQNGFVVNDFNVRVDTMNRQKRVTSGIGQIPTDFGQEYDDKLSLATNNELQQVGGRVAYPTRSYAQNGIRISDELNEPYLHNKHIENVVPGPDYTSLSNTTRYYTTVFDINEYVNAVVIELEDSNNINFNSNTHAMLNCSLQCKINGTGWTNGNAPYKGVLSPTNDYDFAMSVSHSVNGKYYITFGDIPRKGLLYVRFGTNDRNVSFKQINMYLQ